MPLPTMQSAPAHDAVPADLPARLHLPMVVTAIAGLALSMIASSLVWRWETRSAQHEFAAATQSQGVALQRGLDEYLNQLQALRALFEASDHVTRQEFESFAGRLLARQKAIQNLVWAPRVTRTERAAQERQGLAEGIANYRIRAVMPDDKIIASPEHDEYLPIFYVSAHGSSRLYAIDLLPQPALPP